MSTQAANKNDSNQDYNHTWESVEADANWATISEDADGNLLTSDPNGNTKDPVIMAEQIRKRRKRLTQLDHAQSNRRIVRDMIRYLYLVLDLSKVMYEKDTDLSMGVSGSNKTLLGVMLVMATEFVTEYFDQNPLSHLGIVICKKGEAEILSPLSGSKRSAIVALGAVREGMTMLATGGKGGGTSTEAGEFSLQNGLEVAGRSLGHMPQHGSRECIVFVGALSTCDPGDVLVETLPRLVGAGVRVNCLALCAEMHICRKISEETGGIMGVALDGTHLRDLLMNFTAPPPVLAKDKNNKNRTIENRKICEFVPMGFPERKTENVPSLMFAVSAAGKEKKLFLARTGYVCPRCNSKVSELPTDCAVCGLKLVLAPHLARSFHHLFPVPAFNEIPEEQEMMMTNTSTINNKTSATTNTTTTKIPLPPPILSSSDAFIIPPKIAYNQSSKLKSFQIDSSLLVTSEDCDRCCFSCLKLIGLRNQEDSKNNNMMDKNKNKKNKRQRDRSSVHYSSEPEILRFQCPDCKNLFCATCDAYLHETLHNCPGCLH